MMKREAGGEGKWWYTILVRHLIIMWFGNHNIGALCLYGPL